MRVVVFGASGGVGRRLLEALRSRGHEPIAVVRGDAPPEAAGCLVRRGDVLDPRFVRGAVEGAEVALSALGPKRVTPANPFSALAGPPDFAERSARHVVAALADAGLARVIAVSAGGIGPMERHPMLTLLRATSTLGPMYADLVRMEAVYAASALDWQCVRPVVLTNGAPTGGARRVERFGLFATITRADVAAWMVDQLDMAGPLDRTPMIAA